MPRNDITAFDDIIDLRDVIERFEELSDLKADTAEAAWLSDYQDEERELTALAALLDECKDAGGGDEQWRGDWYPVTLIRDDYFTTYAQELLEDCGDIPANTPHYIAIDWERTARNIRVDYTSVEFEGVTYWTR